MKHSKLKRILGGLGLALVILLLGYVVIRPFHLRWGATGEEISRAMPGDLAGARWTRAVTIATTPAQVWPWLAQWGQGRGGWYSYDWLENLFGFDIHTAERILPEHQNPQVGDPICMAANTCTSFVSVVEPHQWFGWQARDENGQPVWNFVFGLFPVGETRTRLVVRESFDPTAMPAAVVTLIEIPDVVMELKALDTVKQRAEGQSSSPLTTAYEIAAWLAALVIGAAAGVLFVQRANGWPFLAVGLAAVIVLLLLTFLFPALWLRGVFDLGLLAGLIWSHRQVANHDLST